jgi:hypothetical protein
MVVDGPFVARSASDNTSDWPFWYVHGPDKINRLTIGDGGKFVPRHVAEQIADRLNGKSA